NLLCEEIVETYEHRHRVKPGITGWAQVNGSRGPTDTPRQLVRRVELDLYYIENWSVYLDIKILILTVLKVFNDEMAF
ncbi:sugar transferase, partial [Acinetobacter baumannii]